MLSVCLYFRKIRTKQSNTDDGPMASPGSIQHIQVSSCRFLHPTLSDWNENDFRLFVGNLGREVTTEILSNLFRLKYPSFTMARVVESKVHKGSAGYGFVAFSNALEGVKALKEMNGKLCGNRPMKIKRSEWQKKEESVISFVVQWWCLHE